VILKLYCAYAGSSSKVKSEADSSDITEHPRDDIPRPYLCAVCHKRFKSSKGLNMHNKRHTGENVYSCTRCDKCFSSQGGMYSHMNIHTGKYKCTECGKCCLTRQHLARHRRSHSGEKPFECTVCSKRFIRSGHLVRHSRIHSGEKPYKCHVCEKAFSQSSNLHLLRLPICTDTRESTREINRITVLTVGSCLRQTLI